jgi:hypothetical protein
MKNQLIKTGLVASVAGLAIIAIRAQPSGRKSDSSRPSTNWVGYLVIGKTDVDPIAIGPHPVSVNDIQLGLRNDGVVVWRRVADNR